MAVIYSYPIKAVPEDNDLILISDGADRLTKQIRVSSLPGGSSGNFVAQPIGYDVILPPVVGTAGQVLALPTPLGNSPYQLVWVDNSGSTPPTCTVTVTKQVQDASTNLSSDGQATLTISNGTAPFDVTITSISDTFSKTNQNSPVVFTDLPAATYFISGQDADDCPLTGDFTVGSTVTCSVVASAVVTDASSPNQDNGSVSITMSGGTAPYAVQIQNIVTGSGFGPIGGNPNPAVFNNLPGNTTWEILGGDALNCPPVSPNFTVGADPCTLEIASVVATPETGTGLNDGTITINFSGGTSDFLVLLTNSDGISLPPTTVTSTPATIIGLKPDTWSILVTDAVLCTAGAEAVVSPYQAGCNIQVSSSTTDETVVGQNDGEVDMEVIGGALDFDLTFTNTTTTNSFPYTATTNPFTVNSLEPGSYTVEGVDSNACIINDAFVINQGITACDLKVTITTTNAIGAGYGEVDIVVENGSGEYTVIITDSSGQSQSSSRIDGVFKFLDLEPGTYTVTGQDESTPTPCPINDSFIISSVECSIKASVITTNQTATDDGKADISIASGLANFQVEFTSPTNNTISGIQTSSSFVQVLNPGDWDFKVTDANGCEDTASFTILPYTDPCSEFSASGVATNETGPDADDGTFTLTVDSGGTAPYSVTITSGDGPQTQTNQQSPIIFTELSVDSYTYAITDANNCTLNGTFEITAYVDPCNITTKITTTDETFQGLNNGSANIELSGGATEYQVTITDGTTTTVKNGTNSQIVFVFPDLAPGTWSVTVKDSDDCEDINQFTINAGASQSVTADSTTITADSTTITADAT